MTGETEVIVAAEVDERSPIDCRAYSISRFRKSVNGPARAAEMFSVELRKRGRQVR
jgi:hypothetical protein